jgi:hypothetical protein
MEDSIFVVFADALEDDAAVERPATTLEQAFALIVCRCGYAYAFERGENGWSMILTDVENPSYSPDSITTTYEKADAAKRDLVAQACDGRLKGYITLPLPEFRKRKMQIVALQSGAEYESDRQMP